MSDYRFFPFTVNIEVTDNDGKAFIRDNIEEFLDWLFLYHDHMAKSYIDDKEEEFAEFLMSGGAGQ